MCTQRGSFAKWELICYHHYDIAAASCFSCQARVKDTKTSLPLTALGLQMKSKQLVYVIIEIVVIVGVFIAVWRYFNPLHKRIVSDAATQDNQTDNLLLNGSFQNGLTGWSTWAFADNVSNAAVVTDGVLRLRNAAQRLQVGLKQYARVASGSVYRLSGTVRSLITNDSKMGFGARIAYKVDTDKEYDLVWMCEYNNWWDKSLLITNNCDGDAMITLHLGYGNFKTSGEFKNVRLEKIEP
jgi:hypothetical protein